MTPEKLMRTYLEDVVAKGQLSLIEDISTVDMVDEANEAFGGPPGRAGLVAHVKGFRRSIGNLQITVDRISRYRLFLHAEFPESVILDTSRPKPSECMVGSEA